MWCGATNKCQVRWNSALDDAHFWSLTVSSLLLYVKDAPSLREASCCTDSELICWLTSLDGMIMAEEAPSWMQTMSHAERNALAVTFQSGALYLKGFLYCKLTHVAIFMSKHSGASSLGFQYTFWGPKGSTKQLGVLGAAAGALGDLGTSNGTTWAVSRQCFILFMIQATCYHLHVSAVTFPLDRYDKNGLGGNRTVHWAECTLMSHYQVVCKLWSIHVDHNAYIVVICIRNDCKRSFLALAGLVCATHAENGAIHHFNPIWLHF